MDSAAARRVPRPAPWQVDAQQRIAALRWLPSPNVDARPDPADLSLLVIHGIALPPEQFGGGYIDALFTNTLDTDAHPYFASLAELRVSAHVCIFRDGSATQYAAFDQRAWHAGASAFGGRSRCNDFAIGVELEGSDTQAYTDAQYRSLARLCGALMRAYPAITRERIVGHADIAPLRKTDPGPLFDWQRLHFELEFPR